MEYTEEELEYVYKQKEIFAEIVESSILSLVDFIRETIKERWLRGESVNGGKIVNNKADGGYASLSYKKLKLLKNPLAYGNIDLTLTGSLGDKIEIKLSNSGNHEIVSTDSKYFAIGAQFGFEEFGLNAKEKELVMNKLEIIITEKIKSYGMF